MTTPPLGAATPDASAPTEPHPTDRHAHATTAARKIAHGLSHGGADHARAEAAGLAKGVGLGDTEPERAPDRRPSRSASPRRQAAGAAKPASDRIAASPWPAILCVAGLGLAATLLLRRPRGS